MFFFIVLGILSLVYGYVGWRLFTPAGFSYPWNILLWVLLFLFMLMPPLAVLLRVYGFRGFWSNVLSWVAYVSMGFFSLIFVFLVVRDLIVLIVLGVKKLLDLAHAVIVSDYMPVEPVNPDRHRFLVQSMNKGILGVTGVLMGYGFYEATRCPRVVTVKVPINYLPEDLSTLRIVQITDLHVGPTVRRGFIEIVVDRVNRLSPDIIFFTGDLADGNVSELRHEVAPLADLSSVYGAYFVTGNHEYYSGPEAWVDEVNRLGMTVLNNEHRIIQHGSARILIGGVTDYNAGSFMKSHISSPEAAIAGASSSDLKLLLAHQPRSILAAAKAGFDIQISGHTHGGQYFPWNYFVRLQQPYTSGLHQYENTWVYVSRGTGYWGPPLRIGQPSEITVINLVRS